MSVRSMTDRALDLQRVQRAADELPNERLTHELECDRFGLRYSGPLEVGEYVRVITVVDLLDLLERLPKRVPRPGPFVGGDLPASQFAELIKREVTTK